MRSSDDRTRRWKAAAFAAVLWVPLVAAAHHHPIDHDGRAHHVEHSHGAHGPSLDDAGERLKPPGFDSTAVPASPRATPAEPLGAASAPPAAAAAIQPDARAPPGAHRPRAPPV